MFRQVQQPLVGVVRRYEGVFRPHWETPYIMVRVSRIRKLMLSTLVVVGLLAAFRFGFLNPDVAYLSVGLAASYVVAPANEHWAPLRSPDCRGDLDDEGGAIEFDGVVTARGFYGHKGVMQRQVKIVRIARHKTA